nr:PREDICTED: TMV resistance protein N-like [Daucus carota subsp. sativus]
MASTSSQSQSSSVSYLEPPPTSQRPHLLWDVFLSFRGADTRLNFISHLYKRLADLGIRTFKDVPELSTGEVIKKGLHQAIQESLIYVVVFSENYASSTWCLDELVEIYNNYKKMNRLVIGVYYKIEPSVVRRQTGSFAEPFEEYEIRFDDRKERVDKWRCTLEEVAGFSGQHVSAERDEADIITEIVDRIEIEIKPRTLEVAAFPTGLETRVKDITTLMSSDTEGVTIIGMYGMGGVGKTTLAKALYNQLLERRFRCCCFLADVREIAGRENGLVFLQQQFIDEFLRSKKQHTIHNVEEGTKFIRERFGSAKVMVLIDDINELKHYKNLVPGIFGPGSVVIVTTRDEELLLKIGVEGRYRLYINLMEDEDSLALFSHHAFGNAVPEHALKVLLKDILSLAGGLPLALVVFGAYLSTQSEGGWKGYIEKLQRIPDITIQQKLLISLNAIELEDPMLKKIFLDIACFFVGERKREVVPILETYYSYVDHKIDTLKKRCLLIINNRYELRMHHLVRDMGRELARNRCYDEPGKHSRLWVSKMIREVLKKKKGTEAIEGIIPSNFDYHKALEGVTFVTKTFKRMSVLRFLHLSSGNVSGNFEQAFENLRWLRWDHFPLKCLPSEFCPQELVFLALPSSKMRTFWELNMDSHVFEMLTTMDMSYSEDLVTTPDFTTLSSLKTLNLKGCTSLEEVHISIGCLPSLLSLNLSGCVNLRSLPDNICNIRALKRLDVGGCSSLEALPMDLGKIESLKELIAWGLTTVPKIPDSILNLSKLVEFNLSDKEYLETPSSSVQNSTLTGWDVFLSYCSADTPFTSHLYTALDYHEIRTYMGDSERSNGEVIALPQAFWKSNIFVVVLSENYASSYRCLDELGNIVSRKNLVLPVFYKIDASVVEDQTGGFREVFERLQINFGGNLGKVENWRLALKKVAKFSGYHISEDRSETDIINEIVDEILIEKRPEASSVAEYPVRLGYRVKGITTLLSSGTEGVVKFGIHGMAGVGKTTLAKALFEQLLREGSFEGSCFLTDVSEAWKTFKGPEILQQKLVNDVLKKDGEIKVHNVDQGTKLIRDGIISTKVLVVIDDLEDLNQYQSLVGPFVAGSVVIITTRDEEMLDEINVETKYRYMANVLDPAESLALFTQHAFDNGKLSRSLMVFCKDVLHLAGGLPFALQVFGSHLSSRSAGDWQDYIKNLQESPNSTIQQKLMISLDALALDDSVLKKVFLDIACFFLGSKMEEVLRIMGNRYHCLHDNICTLEKNCFLTINDRDELEMHQLLRDMARESV